MSPASANRVRWRIFTLLFGFGCVAYLQQKSVTVAAVRMMPELGLTQMQIGWIESAFLIGYAALQFPGGVIGQRVGARRMFVAIGSLAFAATILIPLAPLVLNGTMLFAAFLGLQLLLGAAQAPVFPVSSGVTKAWFPQRQWALMQGLQIMGVQLAAALTPPLVASLMGSLGWQQALLWPAVPAVGLIALWAWYGRNSPAEHPSVSPVELAELKNEPDVPDRSAGIHRPRLASLLRDRSILLLTLSYASMNYVFYLIGNWTFLYLIQERHVTLLEGGWLAGAPPLGAALGAGIGGKLVAALCGRMGTRWGFRLVPLISLPAAGALLLAAVCASNPYEVVMALSLCFAAIELNEGAYWAATMYVADTETMAAAGVLNTGGNVGGLIGIPTVAYLSGKGEWTAAFVLGIVLVLVAAAGWLGVDTTRRVSASPAREQLARSLI